MLSFLPLDVLGEIWDVLESVSEGLFTYSFIRLPVRVFREVLSILVCAFIPFDFNGGILD